MRVITLKQPWASLVANGYKIYEFRKMNYSYRGKILIHAGKGIDKEAMERVKKLNIDFPQSQIVAEVEIEDVIKCDEKFNNYISNLDPLVYGKGKKHDGYAWKLKNIKKIDDSKQISGKQGIWYIDFNYSK